ncbi:MAG: ParB/RepB/Spo0J family partition protein [Kiritimatiellia bacterium]
MKKIVKNPASKIATPTPLKKNNIPMSPKRAPAPTSKSAPAKRNHGGLGKGLGALIDAPTSIKPVIRPAIASFAKAINEKLTGSILTIPVTEVMRSPWQPRQIFDETALRELADSIRANGIIQPLVCRKLKDGRFELIGGERRLRAAMLAEQTHVPVILVEAEDRKAAELAIVENIQRADLNAIEEAEGYRTLSDRFKLTQAEVSERVGKARASVANAMRLLELPDETKVMVADGRLSAGHAKALLGLASAEAQIRLGRRAVAESLTVRAVERIVATANAPVVAHKVPKADIPESYLRDLIDRLHAFFGTAIRLTPSRTLPNAHHAKGTLEVDFYNNDDLDRILTLLNIRMD